ncbi:MAG TPA: hypothetical protein VGD37_43380 [Kofleriaceae bacterium]|jgi:hypothetical protein
MTAIALTNFAATVRDAIARVPESGRFGSRKVFVSAIWEALRDADRARQNLDTFKAGLFAAHRAQLLSLARADLVAAMPPGMVATSQMEPDRGVTFHFVVDPTWS